RDGHNDLTDPTNHGIDYVGRELACPYLALNDAGLQGGHKEVRTERCPGENTELVEVVLIEHWAIERSHHSYGADQVGSLMDKENVLWTHVLPVRVGVVHRLWQTVLR